MEANEIMGGTGSASVKSEGAVSGAAEKKAVPKTTKKTTRKTVKEQVEVKETPKAAAAPADQKTPAEAKKVAEKKAVKAAEKTEPKKPAVKKTAAPAVRKELYIQFNGAQIDEETLLNRVQADCENQNIVVKELKLYLKPEDNACYYVANGNIAGRVGLYEELT